MPIMSDPEFICQCVFEHVGSRKKDPTAKYLMNNLDDCIDRIQNWIISDSWIPSKPIHTTHIEPSNGKIREIDYVPFYPDCVIHWILIDSIYDKVVPKMDPYCVAGIRGRGPHKMKKKVEYWKHTDPRGMKYGGELDIRHCFPETPHQFIKFGYRQLIKDRYWLSIADKIVDSFRHGLPIGYVTSHWFQNLAMTGFDRYVRRQDGVEYYYRYVDNIHIYGPNKRKLHRALSGEILWLNSVGYYCNRCWQVYRTDYIDFDGKHRGRGIDGVGFVVYEDHTIIRKRTIKRLTRLCHIISKRKYPTLEQANSAACRIGQLKHADMHNYRVKYVDNVISYKAIRRRISVESRRMQREAS